jgi:hypothetical protein
LAITFAYTESTNTVVLTEGTSGTPATFADFVTADRAGTDTDLLVAGSPASDLALTYPVRPVEDLAILVKCIVANKTAEADHIFITGTDWRGAAQTEGIDVTAGNGSYTSTKYWAAITTLDCSDNAAGGGTVWADGDLSVTQDVWGVIWDYGNGQYRVDCDFNIGDNSTATHFQSTTEYVVFPSDMPFVRESATLYMGAASNTYSGLGTSWEFVGHAWGRRFIDGTLEMYNSKLHITTNDVTMATPVLTIYNSLISSDGGRKFICHTGGSGTIKDLYLFDVDISFRSPYTIENVQSEGSSTFGMNFFSADATVTDALITNATSGDIQNSDTINVSFVDPRFHIGTVQIIQDGYWIKEIYTCNISVADKDGTLIDDVIVDCEDTDGTAVWTAGSVLTGATTTGIIDEQQITYRRWIDTTKTLKTYSPHKFTISKAGYETFILDNITIDGKVDWHIELQPSVLIDDKGNLYNKRSQNSRMILRIG